MRVNTRRVDGGSVVSGGRYDDESVQPGDLRDGRHRIVRVVGDGRATQRQVYDADPVLASVADRPLKARDYGGRAGVALRIHDADVDQVRLRRNSDVLACRHGPVTSDDAGHMCAVTAWIRGGRRVGEVDRRQNATGDVRIGIDSRIQHGHGDASPGCVLLPGGWGMDCGRIGRDQVRVRNGCTLVDAVLVDRGDVRVVGQRLNRHRVEATRGATQDAER